jgi:hypothetical protein
VSTDAEADECMAPAVARRVAEIRQCADLEVVAVLADGSAVVRTWTADGAAHQHLVRAMQ